MDKEQLKKELKKICKNFRNEFGIKEYTEYPKAIMTERQKELNTCNINCGGSCKEYKSENLELRKKVISSKDFQDFVKRWNLRVSEEITSSKDFIIRFKY